MKILIIGSPGETRDCLTRALQKQGHEVHFGESTKDLGIDNMSKNPCHVKIVLDDDKLSKSLAGFMDNPDIVELLTGEDFTSKKLPLLTPAQVAEALSVKKLRSPPPP